MSKTPEGVDREKAVGRRRMLTLTSLFGLAGAALMAGVSNVMFFRPRVTYGEPSRFKIGRPATFPLGTRLPLAAQRVTILRTQLGMAAISTTCTQLGCVVTTTEVGFDCPCHGSRFDPDGTVLGGPAPIPLPWFSVALSPDGEVEVDTGQRRPPGAFLEV